MIVLAALAAAIAVGLAVPGTGRGLHRLRPDPRRPNVLRPDSLRGDVLRTDRLRPVREAACRRPPAWWPGERRRIEAERGRVVEFAAALAAEVRSGRPPRAAMVAAVDGQPLSPWSGEVRAAAHADGDVGAALQRAAQSPGAEDLRDVAACWEVAERTGAGLGAALEEVTTAAGERSAHAARVRAQLAGVRTTGWLLATLPLLGMVLAAVAGARPWEVLLGSVGGLGLLVLGAGLDALGVVWLSRMARRVEDAG